MLNQKSMIKFFKENQDKTSKYTKIGPCRESKARKAAEGEIVVTVIKDIIETQNTAGPNDIVIQGRAGEMYIMTFEKFQARYVVDKPLTDVFQLYVPSGTCIAFEYLGEPFKFIAPWNEEMLVCYGDYLATTDDSIPKVYRIERSVFEDTYKKII